MTDRMPKKAYEQELRRLQAELVDMQAWVQATGARIVVIFEGRDAAGKGSTIKRVSEYLNPRVTRVVALPTPTEREKTQWYFQRYIPHLPAAGEIVLMDRSWYNRAGVERVMGYCTNVEYHRFLHQAPIFERMLVEDGVVLLKYWFSVSPQEQEARFRSRAEDPMRRWKLSPNDVLSITRWEDYSRAKDTMFVHTDIPEAPWFEVPSVDKRRSRDQHDPSPALAGPLRDGGARGGRGARPVALEGLRAAASQCRELRARPRRHGRAAAPARRRRRDRGSAGDELGQRERPHADDRQHPEAVADRRTQDLGLAPGEADGTRRDRDGLR